MRTVFLLLAPAILTIAGCSEKIEAQKGMPAADHIGAPTKHSDEEASASDKQDTDLQLHSPVALD